MSRPNCPMCGLEADWVYGGQLAEAYMDDDEYEAWVASQEAHRDPVGMQCEYCGWSEDV